MTSLQTPTTAAEPCARCRSKGVRYFGRGTPPVPCGTCKGLGYRDFSANAEKRAHTREVAAVRKAKKLADSVAAFQAEYPRVWVWMTSSSLDFAKSLRAALAKYGSLTDRQLTAAKKFAR